jgi:hypothetical protein
LTAEKACSAALMREEVAMEVLNWMMTLEQ